MLQKLINAMRKPSALQLAQAELDEARREMLAAEAARDYANAMVGYHTARIARLETMMREASVNA